MAGGTASGDRHPGVDGASPGESAIVAAIRLESEAQAAAIVAAARARCDELVAQAQAAADEHVRRACRDAEPVIARDTNRTVNAARVRAIHDRTRADADRVDAVFAGAARQLAELAADSRHPRWRASLTRFVRDADRFTGPGSTFVMRAIDRGIDGLDPAAATGPTGGLAADPPSPATGPGDDHTLAAGPLDPGDPPDPAGGAMALPSDPPDPAGGACEPRAGVVSRSSDGRLEVDATIEARLARARLLLADVVVRVLAGGEAK